MESLKGQLLVASPYLSDRNFFRSVVLIITHDQDHAFGLLLNRPNHTLLDTVWQDLTGESCKINSVIRSGGPLDGPLMLLHRVHRYADMKVMTDVYLSTQQEYVKGLLDAASSPLVPIMGYSGWGPRQLENELEVGGWMVLPATPEVIFASPDEQWSLATRQISNSILAEVTTHVPQDSRWN